jgi:hypothetical protein
VCVCVCHLLFLLFFFSPGPSNRLVLFCCAGHGCGRPDGGPGCKVEGRRWSWRRWSWRRRGCSDAGDQLRPRHQRQPQPSRRVCRCAREGGTSPATAAAAAVATHSIWQPRWRPQRLLACRALLSSLSRARAHSTPSPLFCRFHSNFHFVLASTMKRLSGVFVFLVGIVVNHPENDL